MFRAREGGFDVVKEFVVNELVDLLFLGKALEDAVFVLPHASMQFSRHADTKAAGMAAHNVDPPSFGNHWEKS